MSYWRSWKRFKTVYDISCNYCNFFGITQSPLNTVKELMLGTLPLSPIGQVCVYVYMCGIPSECQHFQLNFALLLVRLSF